MNINIYEDYVVGIWNTYTYVSDEDSLPDDWAYRSDGGSSTITINGGELLDMLKKKFSEDWLQEVVWKENSIRFEYFNPMNGEGSTVKYTIEDVIRSDKMNNAEDKEKDISELLGEYIENIEIL